MTNTHRTITAATVAEGDTIDRGEFAHPQTVVEIARRGPSTVCQLDDGEEITLHAGVILTRVATVVAA